MRGLLKTSKPLGHFETPEDAHARDARFAGTSASTRVRAISYSRVHTASVANCGKLHRALVPPKKTFGFLGDRLLRLRSSSKRIAFSSGLRRSIALRSAR